MDRGKTATGKEAYEKPAVLRIKLAKSELAAAGCKRPSSRVGPTTGCVRSGCRMPGS
jgi:hypothetical protein